eukprot:Sspe_Gene.21451::Locus_8045_Transcript_1_1_Confidence_1.000_Length_1135::g.21451::m.21451
MRGERYADVCVCAMLTLIALCYLSELTMPDEDSPLGPDNFLISTAMFSTVSSFVAPAVCPFAALSFVVLCWMRFSYLCHLLARRERDNCRRNKGAPLYLRLELLLGLLSAFFLQCIASARIKGMRLTHVRSSMTFFALAVLYCCVVAVTDHRVFKDKVWTRTRFALVAAQWVVLFIFLGLFYSWRGLERNVGTACSISELVMIGVLLSNIWLHRSTLAGVTPSLEFRDTSHQD